MENAKTETQQISVSFCRVPEEFSTKEIVAVFVDGMPVFGHLRIGSEHTKNMRLMTFSKTFKNFVKEVFEKPREIGIAIIEPGEYPLPKQAFFIGSEMCKNKKEAYLLFDFNDKTSKIMVSLAPIFRQFNLLPLDEKTKK